MKTDEYRNYGNDSVRFINHVWLWEEIVMNDWIPLHEDSTLPKFEVLCINANDKYMIGYLAPSYTSYTDFMSFSDTQVMYNVVAWMPLPKYDHNPHTKKVIV